MRATDAVHLGLMLAAVGATYLVPFELLLLSYVILGPAHYFTEISWLHDRKYFLPHRSVPLGLAFVAVIAALIDNASWFGFVMWSAFVACALFATAAASAVQGSILLMIATGLTILMYANGLSLAVLGILLPPAGGIALCFVPKARGLGVGLIIAIPVALLLLLGFCAVMMGSGSFH